MSETALMRSIRLYVNMQPDCRVFRNDVGEGVISRHGRRQYVTYGLSKGSADLVGVGPRGRALFIEVKTTTGRLSADQVSWLAAMGRLGAICCVARSIDDVKLVLEGARR